MASRERPRIGFVGLGYVGLVTATVLAAEGYRVVGVDVDPSKVRSISRGEPPFMEPGLEKILSRAVESGALEVSDGYEALAGSDIVFVTVGTPQYSNGEINLGYVFQAVEGIVESYLDSPSSRESLRGRYPVIAIKSTVIPGTALRVARFIEDKFDLKVGEHLGVVSNPEFLREGRAVEDTRSPSRVVIGEVDKRGADILEGFWRGFYEGLGVDVPILRFPAATAEMIKYASNAFLALKISFANTIARLCEKIPGCDVEDVVRGMGYDPRINPSFLGAGLGYGGSCFPKDLRALIHYSRSLCVEPRLLEAVDWVNSTQVEHAVKLLEERLGGLEGKVIAVLGVAFKPGTDDVRESRSIELVRLLAERGARVRLHDPSKSALERASRILGERVEYYYSVEDALRGADAAVIATAWDNYKRIEPREYVRLMRRPLLLDARRIYEPGRFIEEGVEFYAIGLGVQR